MAWRWDDNLEGPGREFAANEAARLRALAGPGTGKTHPLLRRIARLLEAGLRGTELLVLTFARTAAHDLEDKLRRLGEQDERYREIRARTLHAYAFGVLGGEGFLHASDRVPRIALEFERDFLLQDLQGAFDLTLTGRRELTKAFEAAWARAHTDDPGQPVDGLDQSFQDALLGALRWHKAMLVGEVVPLTLAYLRQNPNAPERQGIDPGMRLVLANSRRIGYAIRDAVQARGIEIRSFFREQAVESEAAQERLTLLTLFAKPDDRLALRSWLGLGSATALVGTYRAVLRAAQERGTSVGAVLHAIDSGELNVPRSGPALAKWRDLQAQIEALEPLRDNLRAVIDAILPDAGLDPAEDDLALLRHAATEAYGGRVRESRTWLQRAVDAAVRNYFNGNAAVWTGLHAVREALLGHADEARAQARAALELEESWETRALAAVALARVGDLDDARQLAGKLSAERPRGTLVQNYWLPLIHAQSQLHGADAQAALESLRGREPYDLSDTRLPLLPAFVRGEAYLLARDSPRAAAEFQKLLQHRGAVGNSVVGSLAHVGLGRALALAGDTATARAQYASFFELWREADPETPLLRQAQAEYRAIGPQVIPIRSSISSRAPVAAGLGCVAYDLVPHRLRKQLWFNSLRADGYTGSTSGRVSLSEDLSQSLEWRVAAAVSH